MRDSEEESVDTCRYINFNFLLGKSLLIHKLVLCQHPKHQPQNPLLPSIMATQSGITIEGPNKPYTVVNTIPRSVPGSKQALVKCLAIGINPV